ncbi:MAG: TRAP transporter large permease subunit, partial [Treponema socranskii subsp. buccale]
MNLISMVCIVMLVFLLLKVPVFISIIIPTIIYFIFTPNLTTMAIVQRYIAGVESIPLLAVPFFVFSGILMNYSGVTKRIMDFAELLTGRMYGGLAQVNVLLSTLMGGLSGSNLADTAMEA